MEDAPKTSLSPCKSSDDSDHDNHKGGSPPVSARRARAGFSDSFSCDDLTSIVVEGSPEEVSQTGALEDCSRSAESETASSIASTSGLEGHQELLGPGVHWRGFMRLFKGSAMKFQPLPSLKSVPKLTRKKSKRIRDYMVPNLTSTLDPELCCLKSSWKNFALSELEAATNDFSHENLIGEGGYAEVYKGQLADGQLVAIKRLTRGSPEEMTTDFLSELGIIVHVDHPNIAKLIGYGVEGGMHLVLQLSPHGSLASLLYGPKEKLDWKTRYKVALGTAEGLFYLHEGCQRRIIHKDIKASNILLTEDFEAQISDFGLAKWLPDQWTHHTVSKVEGTFGYLPPEFFMHGIVDEKTDVYAYGVLLLELITGRQALDSSQHSLVMWAKPLITKNNIKELVDPTLGDAYDEEQLNRLVLTASSCIHQSSISRPQMSQVVQILKGDNCKLEQMKKRQMSKLQRTYSEELLDAEDYNSSKYLNDLNRHMEIVMSPCNDS
ncbi:receptor-like cytosolic serine/threonine-protein kinase RBK2 [Carica papaya]|uniref:receptor-like cytosolic serine/threonine-protein kinase RBK2 n=1 Tax=Carica papaya TaxID=3649 RepID=UPI000B8CA0F5|nr:receptor-like cytosolic serine/threonine-protein kinase RBK2 [Carica papaya]